MRSRPSTSSSWALAAGLKTQTTPEYSVREDQPQALLFGAAGSSRRSSRPLWTRAWAPGRYQRAALPVYAAQLGGRAQAARVSRYDIIFAIFEAQRAPAEGQLEIQLARLKYELPRIIRSYEQLLPRWRAASAVSDLESS